MKFSPLVSLVGLIVAVMSNQVLAATNATNAADNNFAASCSRIGLSDGHILTATCGDGHGNNVASSTDLNFCIANAGGNLRCQVNGNYLASCGGCSLQGTFLQCSCGGVSGEASVDTNGCIGNAGGQLVCQP
ncbi:unnamed protein product [Somion occarium]|uniref:Cyanovirin-N domain-containing protein n=1 Tax=Somion occarium TaxID=3059160 RepID=A0ABP1DNM1_9APHY